VRQAGLLLFSVVFFDGAWRQLTEPGPRAEQGRRAGLPVGPAAVRASGASMLLAALGLLVPRLRRWAALYLALQVPALTWIGHRFWEHEPPDRFFQELQFLKNLSLTGAALYIAAGRGDGRSG
jgi:uncharacterized membrane protein YphA (DoxX/SURF4 family)